MRIAALGLLLGLVGCGGGNVTNAPLPPPSGVRAAHVHLRNAGDVGALDANYVFGVLVTGETHLIVRSREIRSAQPIRASLDAGSLTVLIAGNGSATPFTEVLLTVTPTSIHGTRIGHGPDLSFPETAIPAGAFSLE